VASIPNTLVTDYVCKFWLHMHLHTLISHTHTHTQLNLCCNTTVMLDDINNSFVQDELEQSLHGQCQYEESWLQYLSAKLLGVFSCDTVILRVTRTVRIPVLTNRVINLNCAVTPNVRPACHVEQISPIIPYRIHTGGHGKRRSIRRRKLNIIQGVRARGIQKYMLMF